VISLDEIERRGKRVTTWDDVVGYRVVAQTCCGLRGTIELIVEKDEKRYKISAGLLQLKIKKLEEGG